MKRKRRLPDSVANRGDSPDALPARFSDHDRRVTRRISLVLIGLILIVYAPTRYFDFILFDTGVYVTQNPYVIDGLTWNSIRWAFTTNHGGYWIPLTWLSQMLDTQLFGMAPGPRHWANVVFHIASSLLLFALLRRVTGAIWQSGFVAALFAIHPLNVETVVWLAERKGVLSALLCFVTMWAYLAYVRKRSFWRYLTVAIGFALALMAKPMAVVLPFAFLLLDYWPLCRARFEIAEWRNWGRLVSEKVPLIVLAIGSGILTVMFHSRVHGLASFPLYFRLGNAVTSYVAYIRDAIWPAKLAIFYPYPSAPGWTALASVVLLIVITAAVIWKGRSYPYLVFGWLWYLGTAVPVIGLVQAGNQARADRFTYIPLIGLFVIVAWGVPQFLSRWKHRTAVLVTTGGLLIAALTIAARIQVGYWVDRVTLWEHAQKVTSDNYVILNGLGAALSDENRLDEAIDQYRKAALARPDYASTFNNLGTALARRGNVDEGVAAFREALRVGGPVPDVLRNLGLLLAQQGNTGEAMDRLNESLRLEPNDPLTYTNMGDALFIAGNVREAIAHYRYALRIRSDFAVAHNNLAVALASLRQYQEAIEEYYEALRIQPTFAEARYGIGSVLAEQGRYKEAITHFREALLSRPNYAKAQDDLQSALKLLNEQEIGPAIASPEKHPQ